MAETVTTIDPNLSALLPNSGQLTTPLFSYDANSHSDIVTKLQERMQSTQNIEQMTITPTFSIEQNRNTNEIFKFNPAINGGIDDGTDIESTSDAPYVIPLKIILPVDHVHKSKTNNSFERYNYILLKVDDLSYHKHIPSDNSEILFPVNDDRQTSSPTHEMHTSTLDMDNEHETTTTIVSTENVFDIAGNERVANSVQNTDIQLVDSQGYRYELSHHIKIMNELETNVVEFDSIAMVRAKPDTKPNSSKVTKRILTDDDEHQQHQIDDEKTDLNVSQYERHYAKIFQWLHYHL